MLLWSSWVDSCLSSRFERSLNNVLWFCLVVRSTMDHATFTECVHIKSVKGVWFLKGVFLRCNGGNVTLSSTSSHGDFFVSMLVWLHFSVSILLTVFRAKVPSGTLCYNAVSRVQMEKAYHLKFWLTMVIYTYGIWYGLIFAWVGRTPHQSNVLDGISHTV